MSATRGAHGDGGWPWSIPGPITESGDPMSEAYVYILECGEPDSVVVNSGCLTTAASADRRMYVGSTVNPAIRITDHINGDGARFTSVFPPTVVVSLHGFPCRRAAAMEERSITSRMWKAWSRQEVFTYSC